MTTPAKEITMKREIIYRKVYIKDVNDLPTKEDEYIVHTKKDRLEVHIWYGANFNINWMALVDWYLLPVELPTEEEIDDKFNNSPLNPIHPDRFKSEGAKWLLNKILGK